ncbi:type I-F CRISPR-associated endoribonuclease Cas6/Csy4 [Endozoicomonas ascidiicola]|uniref:type I-F CRISPR-associated endoribonuclease Cas6/Csy4 n=1 Tax=Endozoicomonas ascidiicola TaxID=1698521 RepID=UPI000AC20DCE|nr:type I-F CRISPR-associated endoribonuclease Cas6/Csy4 [Endozoicomonas ascidiicola]
MNYLSFKIIPDDADPRFLLGYILQEAHPIIARYGNNKIGTLFPEWNVDEPGRSIAFCGALDVLNRIMKHEYFRVMIDAGVLKYKLLDIDPINHQKVIFLKNQKITSNTPKRQQGKIKRIIKRQIERGEIQSAREYRPRTDQQQTDMPDVFYHLFFLDSKSTEQIMPLCIQMIPVAESEGIVGTQTFDHYGFSTLEQHRAVVPLISPIF